MGDCRRARGVLNISWRPREKIRGRRLDLDGFSKLSFFFPFLSLSSLRFLSSRFDPFFLLSSPLLFFLSISHFPALFTPCVPSLRPPFINPSVSRLPSTNPPRRHTPFHPSRRISLLAPDSQRVLSVSSCPLMTTRTVSQNP